MKKYTGTDLIEMRGLIARCVNHRTLHMAEKAFITQMHEKAARAVLNLTEKQDAWLLNVINRVVTYQNLHGFR